MIDYNVYLCTDSELNKNYSIEEIVQKAIIGGVTIVQYRDKNKSTTEMITEGRKIQKITNFYDIPLIINDNIDVATEINADGVHIGQNDISCLKARKILGNEKIIGVTVTNLYEAKKAVEDGASYLGVGAMFKTNTKLDAKLVSMEELKKIVDYSPIPVVVIGGINSKTIKLFKYINVVGYAMVSAIICQDDITKETKKLKDIIDKNIYNNNI